MGYSFYSDSCEILYENDIKINENAVSVQAEYGAIEHAVKTGDNTPIGIFVVLLIAAIAVIGGGIYLKRRKK